jgi:hypothetical protein
MFIFYRQNIQTMIKDITVAKEKIKTNGMVVDGRRYKIDFTGLTFNVISNTIEQNKTGHALLWSCLSPSDEQPFVVMPICCMKFGYIL